MFYQKVFITKKREMNSFASSSLKLSFVVFFIGLGLVQYFMPLYIIVVGLRFYPGFELVYSTQIK